MLLGCVTKIPVQIIHDYYGITHTTYTHMYTQVQIHGPVCLAENVECIVVNHRHRGDTATEMLLETFVTRNNCNLIWMDHEDHAGPSSLSGGPSSLATLGLPYHVAAPYSRRGRRPRKRKRRDYYDDA